jgi:hypothetical protein
MATPERQPRVVQVPGPQGREILGAERVELVQQVADRASRQEAPVREPVERVERDRVPCSGCVAPAGSSRSLALDQVAEHPAD